MKKEKIESIFTLFCHVVRMDGSQLFKWGRIEVSWKSTRLKKKWIESVKREYLIRRDVNVVEARKMVQNRIEWLGFVRVSMSLAQGINLAMMRYHVECWLGCYETLK